MEEITSFIKGAICVDHCLGHCLYIHRVPGTGKTMSVLSVTRNLRTEVEDGNLRPYSFVDVNGLKLASPENICRVIYEALTGHRVHWKKALNLLNEQFSDRKQIGKDDDRPPIVLLIDELDLLVTRNQSVMKTSCKFGKIFLTAMVHELYKTGMAETTLERLAVTVSCLCTRNGEKFPGWDTLLKIGCMLGECRILLCEPGSKHRLQKLQFNFPSDDVSFALKDSQELPWLAKYL